MTNTIYIACFVAYHTALLVIVFFAGRAGRRRISVEALDLSENKGAFIDEASKILPGKYLGWSVADAVLAELKKSQRRVKYLLSYMTTDDAGYDDRNCLKISIDHKQLEWDLSFWEKPLDSTIYKRHVKNFHDPMIDVLDRAVNTYYAVRMPQDTPTIRRTN